MEVRATGGRAAGRSSQRIGAAARFERSSTGFVWRSTLGNARMPKPLLWNLAIAG